MSNLMRLKLLSASLTATLAATACTTLPAPQIARTAQLPVQSSLVRRCCSSESISGGG